MSALIPTSLLARARKRLPEPREIAVRKMLDEHWERAGRPAVPDRGDALFLVRFYNPDVFGVDVAYLVDAWLTEKTKHLPRCKMCGGAREDAQASHCHACQQRVITLVNKNY